MNEKRLKYYAFFGAQNSLGVAKKIENTVEAANKVGYQAQKKYFLNRPSGLFEFIKEILTGKEEVVIIRLYDLFMPLIFPFLILRRLTGTHLILDVPTPRVILLQEFKFDNKSRLHRFLRGMWSYLSWTWVFLPFNRIIQYSEESKFLSFLVDNKTIKMGNGIKVDLTLPIIERTEKENEIYLIAVASLATWHGYDRLIKAIALVREYKPDYKVFLKVVGDGPALSELKELVKNHSLLDRVTFTGSLHGEDLTNAFINIDLGVSSLGLLRKGLSEASDLKTREYMARGLCVIGAGKDPDFTEQSYFRFLVPNDESIEPIAELLIDLKNKKLPTPQDVRKFAEANLSYDAKICSIIGI